MEELLFYSYLKYQKNKKENTVKAITKLPCSAIILLILLVFSTIIGFIFVFTKKIQNFSWMPLTVEAILCLTIYLYTEHFQIKISDQKFDSFKTYCSEILNWLKSTSFVCNQENICELKNRIISNIEKEQNIIKHRNDKLERWAQTLLIPIFLAIFAALIKEQTNLDILIAYAITLLLFITCIFTTIYALINVLDFFKKRKLEQLRRFAEDLQGILDTQFQNSVILVSPI